MSKALLHNLYNLLSRQSIHNSLLVGNKKIIYVYTSWLKLYKLRFESIVFVKLIQFVLTLKTQCIICVCVLHGLLYLVFIAVWEPFSGTFSSKFCFPSGSRSRILLLSFTIEPCFVLNRGRALRSGSRGTRRRHKTIAVSSMLTIAQTMGRSFSIHFLACAFVTIFSFENVA